MGGVENRMRKIVGSLSCLMLLAASPSQVPEPGPSPSFEQGVTLGEAAIVNQLIDPSSAQIDWPYAFYSGTFKALFGKTQPGWITCGYVNAKNRMGGFTGRSWFLLMIRNGAVVSLDIGQSGEIDRASVLCESAVKKGWLTSAPARASTAGTLQTSPSQFAMASAQSNADLSGARGGIGISFAPSPFGAIITAVGTGSDAEKAGLKPGETIESVNGISIKNFPADAMIQAFHADTPILILGVVGVGKVEIPRTPKQ